MPMAEMRLGITTMRMMVEIRLRRLETRVGSRPVTVLKRRYFTITKVARVMKTVLMMNRYSAPKKKCPFKQDRP